MGNKLVLPGINQTQPAPPREVRDCLESWKEIASYLRREVRTVQLWEKREGLPVHRHFHKQLGSVYALRSEIESWKRRVSGKSSFSSTVECERICRGREPGPGFGSRLPAREPNWRCPVARFRPGIGRCHGHIAPAG